MRAGGLNRRVKLQAHTITKNAAGEEIKAWADVSDLFASISYGTGKERRDAAIEQSTQTATFIVRHSSLTENINPMDNRLFYEGRIYDIVSVVPSIRRGEHISITGTTRTLP